ncbi:plastocyanin/azurin family copper-binding protein [Haladaptatus sp. AB618]|uniref:plastocyanin/azurin family copper-binding protein n=1 Tax=Haladaptatus sp. AB618 TaxID=2934173 RepID=UPI00209C2C0E|nr:plastocyanin/azurin family copper-binding protein [Haladaptatus sp. AB618]MCO8256797.1 plastocyanin/azurin family copper-binding protein [Haladaptatus sp. AB618]
MSNTSRSRRAVLLSSGTIAITALAGCTGGSKEKKNEDSGKNGGDGSQKEIRLGAKKVGWMGRAPDSIKDKKNPTLSLKPGQKYKLTWKNLDGFEHELLLLDKNGEELEKSDEGEEKGKTVTMTFTASEKMTKYKCEYHPKTMRGQIKLTNSK